MTELFLYLLVHVYHQTMRKEQLEKEILGFILLLIPFFAILFWTRHPIALDDGLRHMIMATRYAKEGWSSGSWNNFFFAGYFHTHTVDPWFLSDLAYVPFTFIANGVVGLKLATLVFLVILLISALLLLRALRPAPMLGFVFLLLLFDGSNAFFQRLLLGRPFVLLTAVFILAYLCILRRRFLFLIPLIAIATLLSQLFVFPVFLCMCAACCFCIFHEWKHALWCSATCLSGVVFGMLLHPNAIAYMKYIIIVFFQIPFLHSGIGKVEEMQTALFGGDVTVFMGIFCVMLLIFLHSMEGITPKKLIRHSPDLLLSILLFCSLLLMYLVWVRTIDFFWPVTIILLVQLSSLTPTIKKDVITYLHSPAFFMLKHVSWLQLIIIICIINMCDSGFHLLVTDRNNENDLERLSAITHVPAGSKVLNVDWHVFPPLLFLNSSVHYARGIDPALDVYENSKNAEIADTLLERWKWNWSDPKKSLHELYKLYEFPWYLHIMYERQEIDLQQWVREIELRYDADVLVLDPLLHPQVNQNLHGILPVVAESPGLTVFALHHEKK